MNLNTLCIYHKYATLLTNDILNFTLVYKEVRPMFIEIIQKIAETRSALLKGSFIKAKHHPETKNFSNDQAPGDNFPYIVMVR